MSVFLPACEHESNFIRLGIDPRRLKPHNPFLCSRAEGLHVSWCELTTGDNDTRGHAARS